MVENYLMITLFVICFGISAFFSSSEVALFSITRAKVRTLVNEGRKGAKALSKLKENPDSFLITILIGNNIANVAAASLATAIAIDAFGDTGIAVMISTIVVVVLMLVFGEIGPKMYASRYTESLALSVSPTINLLSKLLSPLIWLFNKVAHSVTGGSPFSHHEVTEEEIKEWIDVGQEEGTIEKDEQEMLYSVLEFGDTTVREVMTPRIDVVLIEDGVNPSEALESFKSTGFSRLPVYHDNIDTIIGVLNIKDVFAEVMDQTSNIPIAKLTHEPYFVPDTKKIDDLLRELQRQKLHMAAVLDEYGSFVGIITVEDILEELVGDILDEFDTEEPEIVQINDDVFLVDARMWIDDLNKKLDLTLPTSEGYETIAGLVIDQLGYIPKMGEYIVVNLEGAGIRLIVLQMKGKRIIKIKMVIDRKILNDVSV